MSRPVRHRPSAGGPRPHSGAPRLAPLVIVLGVGCASTLPPGAPQPAEPAANERRSPPPGPQPAGERAPGAVSAPLPGGPPAPPTSAAPRSEAAPAPSASAAPPAPALPLIAITTAGIHVGGGPNDRPTHALIRGAVEPSFPALARCWTHAEVPRGGSFGVDLVIPRGGGRAEVHQVRTALKGTTLRECFVTVLGAVEFPALPAGKTVVSYSVSVTLEPSAP